MFCYQSFLFLSWLSHTNHQLQGRRSLQEITHALIVCVCEWVSDIYRVNCIYCSDIRCYCVCSINISTAPSYNIAQLSVFFLQSLLSPVGQFNRGARPDCIFHRILGSIELNKCVVPEKCAKGLVTRILKASLALKFDYHEFLSRELQTFLQLGFRPLKSSVFAV